MERLLKIGFINVGHWIFKDDRIQYQLAALQGTKNVLYSFISNGVIKYIGKTTMPLVKRMYGYQNPGPSQITNIKVNEKIKDLFLNGQPVDIFVFASDGLLNYGGYKINLAAGLEDSLIYEINPEWNYSGVNRVKEDENSNKEDLIQIPKHAAVQNLNINSFDVLLGKTYYSQGFFNIKKLYSDQLGSDGVEIEIQLGENIDNTIKGYINRTANPDNSPRIMVGKSLSTWIKEHFHQDDILKVDILSPISIKLNLP